MDYSWIKVSPSLSKGISIVNSLDEDKYEQYLSRIVTKLKNQESDHIFTEEEKKKLQKIFQVDADSLTLATKTTVYIFKKILKYIFMPINLKRDLLNIGLNGQKTDLFIKLWSTETSSTLGELTADKDYFEDNPNFSWKLNAEISSGYHKKCKVPKAYWTVSGKRDLEVELTHAELQSIFLQIESIQHEFDNLILP
ncbi:unnamed protein product [Leptosia nina]|uniref:COMM domain-containing protein n=1 Tax=Leptosia nina TaxID=320188 RepID=A0AAV1J152_9NEOP